MPRRIFAPQVFTGLYDMIESEAHHARDVLRLTVGDALELFDESGHIAAAVITHCDRRRVTVSVSHITPAPVVPTVEIFSSLPKGDRADWMVEKLSELGATRLQPLIADRSVVTAKGENKIDRFKRIAIESAKQSERVGVMSVATPTKLSDTLNEPFTGTRLCLSTQGATQPLLSLLKFHSPQPTNNWQLFVGPEGGWTNAELAMMQKAGLTAVSLTTTILRIETAAVVAAALVICARDGSKKD